MRREIYEVYAKVVDANGTYNNLSGYPKSFDSRSYNNDPEKALIRASGAAATRTPSRGLPVNCLRHTVP